MNTEKLLFSIDEACKLLGMSRSLIYAEARAGRICIRKARRRSVIHRDDLKEYIRNLPVAQDHSDV